MASFLSMWCCPVCCRPVQVGIKYGGKGEVDVTGLEMELREPYKVTEIAALLRSCSCGAGEMADAAAAEGDRGSPGQTSQAQHTVVAGTVFMEEWQLRGLGHLHKPPMRRALPCLSSLGCCYCKKLLSAVSHLSSFPPPSSSPPLNLAGRVALLLNSCSTV